MTPAAYITRLKTSHFRNLHTQTLSFGPGVYFVSGANGMGKTNLLDAIYYLCLSRSHFAYGDASAIRHGEKWFRLEGNFVVGSRRERIVLKYQNRRPKVLERNGAPYRSLGEHLGLIPAIMISPEDIQLVTGGPDERRRFLDQTIAQIDPRYLQALYNYNRILRLRNALLKDSEDGRSIDRALLDTYDVQLQAPAGYIVEQRQHFVDQLRPVFSDFYRRICNEAEVPGIAYKSKLRDEAFADLLVKNRERDLFMRRTHAGPHRDELALFLDEEGLRRYASQGQLKTFVLALRLAQAQLFRQVYQKMPLLLLDDLFDRLDPSRVQQLMDVIRSEAYSQIFISDTHPERLEAIDVGGTPAHYLRVVRGRVLTGDEEE